MTTDKSYTDVMADMMEKYKQSICKLLHWDEMSYAEYQYKAGLSYLYWYLPCDDEARAKLERSKLYWNWWKTVWDEHDFVFANTSGIGIMSLDVKLLIYKELHCPRALAVEVKPNNVVLSEISKIVEL